MATAGGGRETAGTHLDDAVAVARRLSNVQWVHVRPPRPWQTHAPPPAPPPTSVRAGRDTAQPRGPTAVVAVSVPTGSGPKKGRPRVPHRQRHPGGCPRLPPPRGRAPAATAAGGGATRETNKTAGGGASPPEAPPWPHTPDAPATTHTVAAPLCHSGTRAGRGRRRAPARGEGHTQRYWTFRAGRGAPPADDARFLAGGCGGQQTLAGRPQQRAPVWPTPTTTRPSSRNWPTRPAPTVARRCGIGSPLPRTAGRPADATGGGGGAGYNVCAPGGEPWVTRHALPYQKGRPRQRRPSSTSQSAPAQRPRRRGAVAAPRCRRPARPCRPVRSGNVGSGGGGRRRKSRLASHAPRDGRLQARPTDGGARRASCVGQTVRERRRRKGSPRMTPPYRTAPCAGVGGAVATRVADGRTHRRGCGCRRHREGRRGPLGLIQSAGMRRLDRRRTVYVFLCFWRVGEEWVVW